MTKTNHKWHILFNVKVGSNVYSEWVNYLSGENLDEAIESGMSAIAYFYDCELDEIKYIKHEEA